MAILSECLRYKKMPEYQKKSDEYSKCKCKSWNLWRDIKLHQYANNYYKITYQEDTNILFNPINILNNDIY
jgi:hypothetical protein